MIRPNQQGAGKELPAPVGASCQPVWHYLANLNLQ
jgi:hypothetical protein